MAIEVNKQVMVKNEEIVTFNQQYIEENTAWLASPPTAADATEKIVTQLVQENAAAMSEMLSQTSGAQQQATTVLATARANTTMIIRNAETVAERAKNIEANRQQIQENQQAVASKLVPDISDGLAS